MNTSPQFSQEGHTGTLWCRPPRCVHGNAVGLCPLNPAPYANTRSDFPFRQVGLTRREHVFCYVHERSATEHHSVSACANDRTAPTLLPREGVDEIDLPV